MSKKFYKENINDLVEQNILEKGGKGSGIKGHVTLKDMKFHDSMKRAAQSGRLDKLRGAMRHFQAQYEEAKRAGLNDYAEHYKKLKDEAASHVMDRLRSGEDKK